MVVDFEYAVGIDIAANSFVASAVTVADEKPLQAPREFANTQAGYKSLQQWLADLHVPRDKALLLMEATGVYWEECAVTLHSVGWRVQVVNPAQVKGYARGTLRRAKTDAVDAYGIARFACNVRLKAWNPPNLDLEELQLMMRQREELVAMKTQELNRLHALERRPRQPRVVIKVVQEHIRFLEKRIEKLEDEFKKQLAKYPLWLEMLEIMISAPGIGFVTAAVFLTESGAFASFLEARQLTAYAGIAPAPHQSGSSVNKPSSISKVGNKRLRCAAYQAAISASRWNPALASLYQRLLAKGKPSKLAHTAVARKILELVFTMVKNRQKFDPEYAAS